VNPPPVPAFSAPLDPGFQLAELFNHRFVATAKPSGRAEPLVIALEPELNVFLVAHNRYADAVDYRPGFGAAGGGQGAGPRADWAWFH